MALEIVWTKRAEQGYDRTIKYLEEKWTEKEIKNFLQESKQFFELLKQYPEILQKTAYHKNVYREPINKYTILTYRIKPRKQQIELINIRSSRKRPFAHSAVLAVSPKGDTAQETIEKIIPL